MTPWNCITRALSPVVLGSLFLAGAARADEPATTEAPLALTWPSTTPSVWFDVYAGAHLTLDTWAMDEEPLRREIDTFAPIVGVRLGVHLTRWLGLEGELGVIPYSGPETDTNIALLYDVQALIAPWDGNWRPHLSIGVGNYANVSGDRGSDIDFEAHYGLGVRGRLSDAFGLRFDAQHHLTDSYDDAHALASNLTLTVAIELGDFGAPKAEVVEPEPIPEPPVRKPIDTDGDGLTDDVDKCPTEPGPRPDGCPLKADPRARVVEVARGIHWRFPFNDATMQPQWSGDVSALAAALGDAPGVRLLIVGHTDDIGSDDYNMGLSQRRAASAKAALVQAGVSSDRIDTQGKGESEPSGPNNTPDQRLENRRVELDVR